MKIFGFVLILLIGLSNNVFCQTPKQTDTRTVLKDSIYLNADQMPSFPGGEVEMSKFIGTNFIFPSDAREQELQGTLYLEFIVRKTGKVEDVKVLGGHIGGGCEEEAIRVIKSMPNWIPAKHKGEIVDIKFHLPFIIKINADNNFQLKNSPIKIADKIDVEPKYFGGQEKLNKYLAKRLKLPKTISNGDLATYKAFFIIDEKGGVSDIKITSNTNCKICEDEVYSAINRMPNWIPAKLNEKNVASWYSLKITLNELTNK